MALRDGTVYAMRESKIIRIDDQTTHGKSLAAAPIFSI
jgi:hypothetical protein